MVHRRTPLKDVITRCMEGYPEARLDEHPFTTWMSKPKAGYSISLGASKERIIIAESNYVWQTNQGKRRREATLYAMATTNGRSPEELLRDIHGTREREVCVRDIEQMVRDYLERNAQAFT